MNYHNITKDDMLNGDGIRTVLWVSGCTHACPNCQNQQTWDIHSGLPFDETAFNEVMNELSKDYVSGITLSGGDPLHPMNLNEIETLIEDIHNLYPTKTIWLYTGYVFEDIKNLEVMKNVDVLVDGRYDESLKSLGAQWVGSTNQRVVDVQASLNTNSIILKS